MTCSVVCISMTDGSGGEQVGPAVARELGFQLVNEEVVLEAAREAGVDPSLVADVERRKSVFARLLDGLTETGPAGAAGFTGYAAIADEPAPRRDSLRGLIVTVLAEIAERGNVVIVAHAASLALAYARRRATRPDQCIAGDPSAATRRGAGRRRGEGAEAGGAR